MLAKRKQEHEKIKEANMKQGQNIEEVKIAAAADPESPKKDLMDINSAL